MNGGASRQSRMFNKKILVLTMRSSMAFGINTVEPLKEIFSNWVVYNYTDKYEELRGELMNRDLLKLFDREKPELILYLAAGEEVYKSTIMKMNTAGSLTLGWFFDDGINFDIYSKWWTDVLSYYVTHDRGSYIKCKNYKIDAILIPIFTNPRYYHPYPCSKKYDISFVGEAYRHRKIFFQTLANVGLLVNKYGKGWKKGWLSIGDVVKVYNETKININLSRAYVPDYMPGSKDIVKQIKGKLIEIAMCGGFILTDDAPYLKDYFEPGKEVVCFNDLEDAKRKIEYYLSHEQEREEIAQAGYEKARRYYSSDIVLPALFKEFEELESQKSKNIKRLSWSTESYTEKLGRQRRVVSEHLKWGLFFLQRSRFFAAIGELIQAFLQSPFFVLRRICQWHWRAIERSFKKL